MKRNIHIINQFNQQSFPDSSPVALENLNSVVNYSIDNIICPVMEYVTDNEFESVMSSMISKIRDNGSITLVFHDMNTLFNEYLCQKIKSTEIFGALNHKKNILSKDKIINVLSKYGLIVSKIDGNANHIIIIAHKNVDNR